MAFKDVLKNIGQKVKKVASSVVSNAKTFVTGVTQIFSGNIIGGVSSIASGVSDVISDVNGNNSASVVSTPKLETIPVKVKGAVARGLADNDYTKSTDILINTLMEVK